MCSQNYKFMITKVQINLDKEEIFVTFLRAHIHLLRFEKNPTLKEYHTGTGKASNNCLIKVCPPTISSSALSSSR